MEDFSVTPQSTAPIPQMPNRLEAMNRYIQNLYSQNGNVKRPELWIGNNQKKVAIPGDTGGGGSFICSTLRRAGIISTRDFIWLTNGHAVAAFTNGDFVNWYMRNAGRLVMLAEGADFDWKALTHLIDRM